MLCEERAQPHSCYWLTPGWPMIDGCYWINQTPFLSKFFCVSTTSTVTDNSAPSHKLNIYFDLFLKAFTGQCACSIWTLQIWPALLFVSRNNGGVTKWNHILGFGFVLEEQCVTREYLWAEDSMNVTKQQHVRNLQKIWVKDVKLLFMGQKQFSHHHFPDTIILVPFPATNTVLVKETVNVLFLNMTNYIKTCFRTNGGM